MATHERTIAPAPFSCDTFVVLPPLTKSGGVIFGKNSDRPGSEVQEVVYVPERDFQDGDQTQCTYISVPAAAHTHAVMLSKPAWMWGAEIGANQHGLCIGNEAIFTKVLAAASDNTEERLLGMDLVRLGLERSQTAKEALDVMTSLLHEHGQGGRCMEDPEKADFIYHNSFIIVDSSEAWVLETAGKHWAAEHVTSGLRNISNMLTIGTKIDAMSTDLKKFAQDRGFWDGNGDFHFAEVFQDPSGVDKDGKFAASNRYACGKDLLTNLSKDNGFHVGSMVAVLRDDDSGICRYGEGEIQSVSTGSQVSLIHPPGSKLSCHWFTATPNPACSVFKPFIFVPDVRGSDRTVSPSYGDNDPVKVKPRFQNEVDRKHQLYAAHSKIRPLPGNEVNHEVLNELRRIEQLSIQDIEEYIEKNEFSEAFTSELRDLFKDSVEAELQFYRPL